MGDGFMLGRVVLDFSGGDLGHAVSIDNLSAMARVDAGETVWLWLGTDEAIALHAGKGRNNAAAETNVLIGVREVAGNPMHYAQPTVIPVQSLLPAGIQLVRDKDGNEVEIDIEGLDVNEGCLWLTGSHSAKRRRPKQTEKLSPAQRLARADHETNRFIIARVPLVDGKPVAADGQRVAAVVRLNEAGDGNALTAALDKDEHLGPFLEPVVATSANDRGPLPGKDNGFDIEGLAVHKGRLYLGLRGPVLRGWAMILILAPEGGGNGVLDLGAIGDGGRPYRKLFVYLGGMGIRELGFDGDDLLILAGPTMDLVGSAAVWRLHDPHALDDGTLVGFDGQFKNETDRLARVFDVPLGTGAAKPEAMIRWNDRGERAVLVGYDSPGGDRRPRNWSGKEIDDRIYVDLFRLAPR